MRHVLTLAAPSGGLFESCFIRRPPRLLAYYISLYHGLISTLLWVRDKQYQAKAGRGYKYLVRDWGPALFLSSPRLRTSPSHFLSELRKQ